MRIITRKEWGAVPPESVNRTAMANRTGFMVHYSAASATQSVRDIQRFHMETRGWSDIGYNFLVRSTDGTIYEGRGWDVIGAHAAGHNVENIGVCVIGADRDGVRDVSDAARAAVAWLYAEANRRAGRQLARRVHRDVGATQCPGDELAGWVRAGMPLASAPTPTPPPAPRPPAPSNWTEQLVENLPTLRLGDGNRKAVLRMQALINTMGGGLVEDGVFGPKTDAAVRTWQVRHRVPNSVSNGRGDGIFGRACWSYSLKV